MSYQNINQYNWNKLVVKQLRKVSDISLTSDEKNFDEEVVFSNNLIAEFDGGRLPLKFDFNSTGTTICVNCGDPDTDVIVSENYWNPKNLNLEYCTGSTELCDVGLTGIDNGLVNNITGFTIELNTGLYLENQDKYSRYKYDARFKMHPITGYTQPSDRIYNDSSYDYGYSYGNAGGSVGKYLSLSGGFYQGFYKLQGYDYEVLPERFNWGWSAEFLLRPRRYGSFQVGLNLRYPENTGIFFYLGARAENKFYHFADGHPNSFTAYTRVTEGLENLKTCECEFSATSASTSCTTIYPQSSTTRTNCSCGCPCNCSVNSIQGEENPLLDGVSNALAFRLSGITNPRLCVKTYRITGGCETTGSCETTGITYTTGTSLTEWCSTRGIFDDCKNTEYINGENWVQIDAVFIRDTYLEDCDLEYKGGLKEIVKQKYFASLENNSVSLVIPPTTHEEVYSPPSTSVVNITEKWINEKNYRKGKLKFFVNGKLFFVVNDFEEIIPRPLNVQKEKQIGVPFNISIGGGTQGLHDNLTLSGNSLYLQQDPELLPTSILNLTQYSGLTTNIKLEEYFGGSFIGDISAFRFYSEPLNASQVKHNYKVLKNRYLLLDADCPNCIIPTPTQTPSNTPTPPVTPFVTPTPSVTPTLTPTTTIYISPSTTSTPTITPTYTHTPTQTPTYTPIVTQTPATIYRAYLFIEPQTGSTNIGQFMYNNGSNFFGFTNESQPAQNQLQFNIDMNLYVNYTGWTSGEFPTIIQQIVPQVSGGVDIFDNPIVAYNFATTQVSANTVNCQAWYTWIIPTILTNNGKQSEIDFNPTGNPNLLTAVRTEQTIYTYTFNYTGSTIPSTTYRVYTTYPNNIFKLNNTQNIYFRGNSITP